MVKGVVAVAVAAAAAAAGAAVVDRTKAKNPRVLFFSMSVFFVGGYISVLLPVHQGISNKNTLLG